MSTAHALHTAPRAAALLAVLSGIAFYAAFPGRGLWGLALVQWVPLAISVSGATPFRALKLGAVAGIVAHSLGFAWLPSAFANFTGASLGLATVTVVILIAFQAASVAVFAAVTSWLGARWSLAASMGVSLPLVELSFPWITPLPTAVIFHDQPLLLQSLSVAGTSPLSALVGFSNGALARLLLHGLERTRVTATARGNVVAAAAMWSAICLHGYYALGSPSKATGELSVAIIQSNTRPDERRASPDHVLEEHIAQTRAALRGLNPDLVVWGENASARPMARKRLEEILERRLGASHPPVVFGALLSLAGASTNSVVVWPTSDSSTSQYDKQRLVPLTEKLPSGALGRWLAPLFPRAGRVVSSERRGHLKAAGVELLALICYEGLFSSSVRSRTSSETVLLSISYDGWLQSEAGVIAHHAMTKLRATELGLPLVRVSSTGISSLIDGKGRTIAISKPGERAFLSGSLPVGTRPVPYRRLGDAPALGILLVALIVRFLPKCSPGQRWRVRDRARK